MTGNTAPKLHERLLKVAEGLKFNRETHVVWRDWLLKSPNNEKVNPHAGNAQFHDDTIREYDEHLATIDETLAALLRRLAGGVMVDDVMVERAIIGAMAQARRDGVAMGDQRWDGSFPTRTMWRAALVAALGAK